METEHIVKSYDDELGQLTGAIARMGGLAESQLTKAVDALTSGDVHLAQKVIDDDKRIDELETEVDNMAIRLIALRQPMAEDLRTVIASLKAASQLERVGDYAKNIAKRAVTLSKTQSIGAATATIGRMSSLVRAMIVNVLDAYTERDVAKADDVRLRDEEVDQMYTGLFRELLTYMLEDPKTITTCTHLLFVAKNVERMGDHITNVAEQVHFMVSGERAADVRPKGDRSSFTVVEPEAPETGA